MKKIHAVTRWFHPVIAGKELNMLETYSRLVKKGWDITVHTSRSTLTQSDSLPSKEIYRGITIIRHPEKKLKFMPWTVLESVEQESYLCLHDLELFPHVYLYLITLFLKAIRRKKYLLVYSSHGLFTISDKAYSGLRFKVKRIVDRHFGVPLINSTADGIRELSRWGAKGLVSAGINGKLITVIPNGLVNEAFEDSNQNASKKVRLIKKGLKKYILQIGRIDPVKNYEMSIRAMSMLDKDVNLAIVGPDQDHKYKQRLISLINELGLNKRVYFLGVITGNDKFYLLKHAEIFICTSWTETFSNALLEAISQGVPCLVTKGSSLGELVIEGKNGWSVVPGNYQELADKINMTLELKPTTVKKIEKYNRKFSKNYTWDRTAELVSRFYLSL